MKSFTYQQAEDFLFNQLPIYQNQGRAALNRSLDKTRLLLALDRPVVTSNPFFFEL